MVTWSRISYMLLVIVACDWQLSYPMEIELQEAQNSNQQALRRLHAQCMLPYPFSIDDEIFGNLLANEFAQILGKNPELVHAQDNDGYRALHWAACNGNLSAARLLLGTYQADPNAQEGRGMTALHFAATWNYTEMINLLLEHGAIIDLPDTTGNTALHGAALCKNIESIKLLCQRGASMELINQNAKTAYDIFKQRYPNASWPTASENNSAYDSLKRMLSRSWPVSSLPPMPTTSEKTKCSLAQKPALPASMQLKPFGEK